MAPILLLGQESFALEVTLLNQLSKVPLVKELEMKMDWKWTENRMVSWGCPDTEKESTPLWLWKIVSKRVSSEIKSKTLSAGGENANRSVLPNGARYRCNYPKRRIEAEKLYQLYQKSNKLVSFTVGDRMWTKFMIDSRSTYASSSPVQCSLASNRRLFCCWWKQSQNRPNRCPSKRRTI